MIFLSMSLIKNIFLLLSKNLHYNVGPAEQKFAMYCNYRTETVHVGITTSLRKNCFFFFFIYTIQISRFLNLIVLLIFIIIVHDKKLNLIVSHFKHLKTSTSSTWIKKKNTERIKLYEIVRCKHTYWDGLGIKIRTDDCGAKKKKQ